MGAGLGRHIPSAAGILLDDGPPFLWRILPSEAWHRLLTVNQVR
ncbi:hypothetical protein RISK_001776 [Rhodopirellula islandica]|uniref:Uncharacterized protein n=1 Tax=Rhodopirellula islandica TaxID=595434 RepID=A0A0J1BHB7_RHOIS|nr:hypothetical protein RISK_001776 [Rhodopirellula islandica]